MCKFIYGYTGVLVIYKKSTLYLQLFLLMIQTALGFLLAFAVYHMTAGLAKVL